MPDDRFIHRRLGHSEKVSQLSDFEFRVWIQYLLSADDFGVMRHGGANLQADNDALAAVAPRKVQKAIEEVIKARLLRTFDHQGRVYCYQPDWQDWQKVDYPRATLHPAPPFDGLSEKTRELFAKHPGGWGRKVRGTLGNGSANVPQTFPERLGERSGEISPKPVAVSREPVASSREPVDLTHAERAGTFAEWYASKHSEVFDVGYLGNPRKDYEAALSMVGKFTDAELRDAALVWFGMDDDFATSGTRTIPKFASRVTKCVELARRVAS